MQIKIVTVSHSIGEGPRTSSQPTLFMFITFWQA